MATVKVDYEDMNGHQEEFKKKYSLSKDGKSVADLMEKTASPAKAKLPPVLIQRNRNGWIIGPFKSSPDAATSYDDTFVFNDIYDLYAYLGEYYGIEVREDEGAEGSEEGDDKAPE